MMALLGSGLIEDDVGRGGNGRHFESDYKFKVTDQGSRSVHHFIKTSTSEC